MALIKHFSRKDRERLSVHDEIEADYIAFEKDGRVLLQINTCGRKSRQVPGKLSQTIQLDKNSAHALYKILKQEFAFD